MKLQNIDGWSLEVDGNIARGSIINVNLITLKHFFGEILFNIK